MACEMRMEETRRRTTARGRGESLECSAGSESPRGGGRVSFWWEGGKSKKEGVCSGGKRKDDEEEMRDSAGRGAD